MAEVEVQVLDLEDGVWGECELEPTAGRPAREGAGAVRDEAGLGRLLLGLTAVGRQAALAVDQGVAEYDTEASGDVAVKATVERDVLVGMMPPPLSPR